MCMCVVYIGYINDDISYMYRVCISVDIFDMTIDITHLSIGYICLTYYIHMYVYVTCMYVHM